jgi:hypothetical protein
MVVAARDHARAKPGAPNVLFIVLDDTGFGHLGCYGSPIGAGVRKPSQQQTHAPKTGAKRIATVDHSPRRREWQASLEATISAASQ